MRSTGRLDTLVIMALLVVGVMACEMQFVPLSVQAGATLTLPVGDAGAVDTYGYGGFHTLDPQRGQLLLKLDDSEYINPRSNRECDTSETIGTAPQCYIGAHAAAVVVADGSTDLARTASGRQAVAMFNLPAYTPPGKYDVAVYKRRLQEGVDQPDGSGNWVYEDDPQQVVDTGIRPEAARTLVVLPYQLDPDKNWEACGGVGQPSCSYKVVTGDSTSAQFWEDSGAKAGWLWRTHVPGFYDAYPNPQLLIEVPLVDGTPVAALEATITYPSNIEVLDVVQPIVDQIRANDGAMVLVDDDGAGTVTVKAIAHPDQPEISRLALVFDVLMDANGNFTRLDTAAINITVDLATDANGDPLTPLPTLAKLGIL